MKVVILAGGFGTRLSEFTNHIPKPMVLIEGRPIIHHIMEIYSSFGFNDFILAAGYKKEVLQSYFTNFAYQSCDISIDLASGDIQFLNKNLPNWKVTIIDTGLNSLTGTRLKKLQPLLDEKDFLLTYGDGLSSVNIPDVIESHYKSGCVVSMTAVRPSARFGELSLDAKGLVLDFAEKPRVDQGWINGGFFVCSPRVFHYIGDENQMFEREPMAAILNDGQLNAYRHEGFWQCMDTKKDHDYLCGLAETGSPPWRERSL